VTAKQPAPQWIVDALYATLSGGSITPDGLATELLERLPLERLLTQLQLRVSQVLAHRSIADARHDLASHLARVTALAVTEVLAEPTDLAPTFGELYNDVMSALDSAGIPRANPVGERMTPAERVRVLASWMSAATARSYR